VSSRPDALALWYPVIDNGPDGYGDAAVKARYREFSPLHNVGPDTPPAIVFLGTDDRLIPVATARDFQARMKKAGVPCELRLFPGAGHPIYNSRKPPCPERPEILAAVDAFLGRLGIAPAK
jgi:acetyl esterase/lipase